MPKNVQTTARFCSFHLQTRFFSKSFKLSFTSVWTESFQMFKLDLEKAEEPEIKLPTLVWSWRKQENSKETSPSSSLSTLKPLTVCVTTNWKILKKMRIPDHLTCLLTNLYVSQETSVRTGRGRTDQFKVEKGVWQSCILSPCWFNFYAKDIMWNAGLDESQAGIKIARKNSNNLRYSDDTTLIVESKEELKSLSMRVKRESEKAGLKFNIKQTKITAFSPTTSRQIEGGKWKQGRFSFFRLQTHCRSWLQPWNEKMLVPWKESYDKLRQHIKTQSSHFDHKGRTVRAMVFQWSRESWAIKIAEHRKPGVVQLWCWRRHSRAPWAQGDQASQS